MIAAATDVTGSYQTAGVVSLVLAGTAVIVTLLFLLGRRDVITGIADAITGRSPQASAKEEKSLSSREPKARFKLLPGMNRFVGVLIDFFLKWFKRILIPRYHADYMESKYRLEILRVLEMSNDQTVADAIALFRAEQKAGMADTELTRKARAEVELVHKALYQALMADYQANMVARWANRDRRLYDADRRLWFANRELLDVTNEIRAAVVRRTHTGKDTFLWELREDATPVEKIRAKTDKSSALIDEIRRLVGGELGKGSMEPKGH
jgi:hypothetical protein